MFREIWKLAPGYEGYMVSDLGRVKSLNYLRTGKEQILRPRKTRKGGYLQVVLCKDGKSKNYYVHRLVWIVFNGPIPEGYDCNHINEDKTDCRLVNLNLMTRRENLNWGTRNRRAAKSKSKMVEQYTLDGTHICTWFSTMGIERELGYLHQNISNCCLGKQKIAYGFVWKFAE